MRTRAFTPAARLCVALLLLAAFFGTDPGHSSGQELPPGNANELVALLHVRNPTRTLTRAQVRSMFLGQTAFWHGVVPVRLVARAGSGAVARPLYDGLVGMTAAAFAQLWTSRQLAGQGVAPPMVASPAEVRAQVARSPGGVSVLLASEAWSLGSGGGTRIIPIQ